jgi:hypothetical protein
VMPGKHWSVQEKQLMRQQINLGVPVRDLVIPQRTPAGIVYQLHRLKQYPTSRWTGAEVRVLRKEVKSGKPPWEISIRGRSAVAVRSKMIRMNLWKPKSYVQRPWMRTELNQLRHLVIDCGYTARQAVDNGYLPGRSVDSVSQQMRRQGWRRIGSRGSHNGTGP